MTDELVEKLKKEWGAQVVDESDLGVAGDGEGVATGAGDSAPKQEVGAVLDTQSGIKPDPKQSPGGSHLVAATRQGRDPGSIPGPRDLPLNGHKKRLNLKKLFDPNRRKPQPILTYNQHTYALEREIIVVAGDPEVGKSLFLLELTIPGRGVGGLTLNAESVLWIDEEGDDEILTERLALLNAAHVQDDPNFHYYLNQDFYLDQEKNREALLDIVEATLPDVIVIDSMTRVRSSADENSASAMAHFYSEALKPLSRTYGCTVFLIDHTRKRGSNDKYANQQVRGSIEKVAQVDRGWLLRQASRDSFILEHLKSRRTRRPPNLYITREQDGGRLTHTMRMLDG